MPSPDDQLVEPEVSRLPPACKPIEIDVVQRRATAAIFLNQRERRARDVVGRRAEAARQAAHERGLAGAQLTVQEHDVAGPQASRRGARLPPTVSSSLAVEDFVASASFTDAGRDYSAGGVLPPSPSAPGRHRQAARRCRRR